MGTLRNPGLEVWSIKGVRLQIAQFYKLRWCKNRPDKFIRTFGVKKLKDYLEQTGTHYTWKTLLACNQFQVLTESSVTSSNEQPFDSIFSWVHYSIYSTYKKEKADAYCFEYELAIDEQDGTSKYKYKNVIFDSNVTKSSDKNSSDEDENSSDNNDDTLSSSTELSYTSDITEKIRLAMEDTKYQKRLFYYAVIHRLKRLLGVFNMVINRFYGRNHWKDYGSESKASEIRDEFEKEYKNMNEHVRAKADLNTWIYRRRYDDVYCCPIYSSTMLWFMRNDMKKHVHRKYKFKLHSYECDFTPLSLRMTEILAKQDFFKEDYQCQIRRAITRLYPSLFKWIVINGYIGSIGHIMDLHCYGYKNVKTLLQLESKVRYPRSFDIYHKTTAEEISFDKFKKLLKLGLKMHYELKNHIREKEPFQANPNWELVDIVLTERPYYSYEVVRHVEQHIKLGQTSCRVCTSFSDEVLYDIPRHVVESTSSSKIFRILKLDPSLRIWWLAVEKQNVEAMWYCWSRECKGLDGTGNVLEMMEKAYLKTGYKFTKPLHIPENVRDSDLKLLQDAYPGLF